jgi:hypothetical protein
VAATIFNTPICRYKVLTKHRAAKGVIELISIRNAIVHNNSIWNEKTLELLAVANLVELPKTGTRLPLGIDDLFRCRRAVRTTLNLIKNLSAGEI